MRGWALGILFACAPAAVAALSCMPPSVEAAFLQAQKANNSFVIVRGTLDFDARKLPQANENRHIRGVLRGTSLSSEGFITPYDNQVTLFVECRGPWCGTAQTGAEVLAFVEQRGGENVISVTPCGGDAFAAPTQKMLRAVSQCFAGKSCKRSR